MPPKIVLVFGFFALALLTAGQCAFTVDQREQAILLQLGQPVGDVMGPGLHLKLPIVQNVRRFDRRILSVDPPPEQVVISSSRSMGAAKADDVLPDDMKNVSGEPIVVDTFARYRIADPLKFMKSLRTTEAADARIENIVNDATRAILGKRTMQDLLSDKRAAIMNDIRDRVNRNIEQDQLGIQIVDVRIVRADLTPDLRLSTVRRMISELKERATQTRANGEQKALEIRSTAEKERTVLLAEAQRDAQIIKGEGDNEAIKTYATAFNKDKEFYAFTRTMEAYKNTLGSSDTQMILSPGSDFLKYFGAGK
jgi:membrane protease subunit HflC